MIEYIFQFIYGKMWNKEKVHSNSLWHKQKNKQKSKN